VINDAQLRDVQVHATSRTPRQGRPDNISRRDPSLAIGHALDVNNLDTGRASPCPRRSPAPAYNAFIQPLIDRYGYVQNGVRPAAASSGTASQFNDQDFFRDAARSLQHHARRRRPHELHVGYQWYEDSEDLSAARTAGADHGPGGRLRADRGHRPAGVLHRADPAADDGRPAIRLGVPSQSIEINDTIRWNNWTFNVGVLMSNDTLYGQGLREDSSTLSGYVAAPGNKYKMYEIAVREDDPAAPRRDLGLQRRDTVYASYARYNPAASSLPRAASWDRNLDRPPSTPTSTPTAALRRRAGRVLVGQAVRGRHDAAHAPTSS
jgi:hypothetical protein